MNNKQYYTSKNIKLNYKKTEPYEIIISSICISFAIFLSTWFSFVGAALVVLGLWIFTKHYLGHPTIVTKFLQKNNIETQFFTFNKTSEAKKNLLVIIPEKFFISQTNSFLLKIFQFYLIFYLIITGLSIFWLYSKDLMQNNSLFYFGNSILLIIQIIFLIFYLLVNKKLYTSQSNKIDSILEFFKTENNIDNLHIFIKPNIKTISGITEFIQENNQQLTPQNTYILNISNFLSEKITAITQEGVIILNEYENHLTKKSLELNLPIETNKIYLSDLTPFINAGYTGLTITIANDNQKNFNVIRKLLNY